MKHKELEQAATDTISQIQAIIDALKSEIEYLEKENAELYKEIMELKNLISVL